MSGLKYAMKEWAAVCRALADGRQTVVLRKGGVAEAAGEFQLEQPRFWLYPTYFHEQRAGLDVDALPLLEQAEKERPPQGIVRLTHFAEATVGVFHLHDLPAAALTAGLHILSAETVRSRFEYKRPGLNLVPLRVYRSAAAFELPETAEYAGCRSWVELERPLSTDGAVPVLNDEGFRELLARLDRLLRPTAWA
jgi:hypothetical protein